MSSPDGESPSPDGESPSPDGESPSPDGESPSPEGEGQDPVGDLPPALRSMWRLCLLGFRFEPALMGVAFVLAMAAAVPDALLAIWFKLLGEGLLDHEP